jgi:hypothetical protein
MTSSPARLCCLSLTLLVSPLCQGGLPAAGTANLSIRIDGAAVLVDLSAAAQTLVGFTGSPGNAAQRADLRLAAENLGHADALIRLNQEARCVIETTKVDANPNGRDSVSDLGASYRFGCALPDSLRSAAVALFVGFPALARIHVRYETRLGSGEAVLTPANPVVNFIPLH